MKFEKEYIAKLESENSILKEALKPILGIKWELFRGTFAYGYFPNKYTDIAVQEAQRIYNGKLNSIKHSEDDAVVSKRCVDIKNNVKITNGERYKTQHERADAFEHFCRCHKHQCSKCEANDGTRSGYWCQFAWIDLVADECGV